MSGRRVPIILLVAALLTAASTVAARAAAAKAKTIRSAKERGLSLGVSFAGQLTNGSTGEEALWASRARTASASIVRLQISWASIAPRTPPAGFDASDPNSSGYSWTALDQQVRAISRAGFTPMITVSTAPAWAEGANVPSGLDGAWKPNAAAYGQFATAIATRYDGRSADPLSPGKLLPRVRYWQAWNEPNLAIYLSPTWVKINGAWTDQAAAEYRSLLDAFYTSMKAVASNNYVVMAGTAPYGDPPGTENRVPPVTFDQDVFCLNASNQPTGNCANPAEFDATDHHPYVSGQNSYGPTWKAANATDAAIPDVHKLTTVLKAAEKARTVFPAGSKGSWITEIAWQTSPPQPKGQGITAAQDGLWAEQALYILWSEGVSDILWYQLGDEHEQPGGWSATETQGLYYADGNPKPAASALRFPFLTNRKNAAIVEGWGRSPATGTVVIQKLAHKKWVSVVQVKVKAGQVFEFPVILIGGANFRAVINGIHSLEWKQSAGAGA